LAIDFFRFTLNTFFSDWVISRIFEWLGFFKISSKNSHSVGQIVNLPIGKLNKPWFGQINNLSCSFGPIRFSQKLIAGRQSLNFGLNKLGRDIMPNDPAG
jgi:hypothetical protein